MRHILSDLTEVYTDQLIEGYEHYCCECSMSCCSGCVAGEMDIWEKFIVVYSYYYLTI